MHTNKINDKKYIGITCRENPKWRWGQYGQKYQDSRYFWNAIQKYGWENFEHKILFYNLSEEEAKQKEIELIAKYNTTNRKLGYNISAGGGDMSHLKGKNHPYFGKHFSGEHRRKIVEFNKNRIHSQKEIEKATNRLLNYMKTHPNPFLGKNHSLDFKKKKSKEVCKYWSNHKHPREGASLTQKSKDKIAQGRNKKGLSYSVICIESGKIYISLRQASKDMGISRSSISDCCKGKKENVKGYHFKYLNKNNKVNYNGKKRKVVCIETNKIYDSLADAGRDFNVDKNSIWRCCQENFKTTKGYHFKYYDDEERKQSKMKGE